MEKSALELKWKAFLPKGSNGFWYVETTEGDSICTTYSDHTGKTAKKIASDHNKQLKLSKNLKNHE